jgi:hypothetical protein
MRAKTLLELDIMLGQVEGHRSRENHGCDGLKASREQPAYEWKT